MKAGGQRADGYRTVGASGYEHRIVAERELGRPLRKGEDVHHINGDPSDNRPENLLVLSHAAHLQLHHGAHLTDGEVKELILVLGYSYSDLIRVGVWQSRTVRLRKELRAAGYASHLDRLSRWRMVTAHRFARSKA